MPKMRRANRAFTLVELLIVCGIIAILAGIMIPVVSKVRASAYRADTANQISVLQGAINQYYQNFQAYPGPYSDQDIYNGTAIKGEKVTMAENLVLGLLGGAQVQRKGTKISSIYNPDLVGTGPRSLDPVNPKAYEPFLSKFDGWLSNRTSPYVDSTGRSPCSDSNVPEFIDRYPSEPMPILYLRARRGASGIISDTSGKVFQYNLLQILPYTSATINGKQQGLNQLGSLSDLLSSRNALPYFKDPTATQNQSINDQSQGVPRCKDGYILISAGPDRIYGTADDITSFGNLE